MVLAELKKQQAFNWNGLQPIPKRFHVLSALAEPENRGFLIYQSLQKEMIRYRNNLYATPTFLNQPHEQCLSNNGRFSFLKDINIKKGTINPKIIEHYPQLLPFWLHSAYIYLMRVIAVRTLKNYWEHFPVVKQSLLAWHEEVLDASWNSPNDLKLQYRNASIITEKRVVFNIKGNHFRLVVDIEYRLKIVFVVWFGTHAEYDKIDVKQINYVKTNKD